MWNPFGKRKDDDDRPESMLPARPALDAGDHAPSVQPPPEHPAVQAAPRPDEPAAAEGRPRSQIAEVQRSGDVAVATITVTELSHDSGVSQLADLLGELAETGAASYVLDVHMVQFMDSACLGCLVEALNRLAANGGRIALANGNHSVQYLFRLTRLDRVFAICPDVLSAIKACEDPARKAG